LSIAVAAAIVVAMVPWRTLAGPLLHPYDMIAAGAMIAALLGFALWLLRATAVQLGEVARVCASARNGDLETRIMSRRDGGDVGTLQASVNNMLDVVDAFVREASVSMEFVSRGKCFRKVVVRGLPGTFRHAASQINSATEAMDHKVKHLARAAHDFGANMEGVATTLVTAAHGLLDDAKTMAASAEETSRQSVSVASGSERASANVQTVASAAEELSASIVEISRQIQLSTSSTNLAVEEAVQTNAKIGNLAEAAQRIGDVVKLINAVAAQTNLLALNATIEAARAGESGKGFAVVASEVKALATQTAKATEEITTRIAEMQSITDQSVDAVQAISRRISDINEVSSMIAAAVEQQGAATREIASNVQQASAGTAEVSCNIDGISHSADHTGKVATRVNDVSNQIASQVDTLRDEVERFLKAVA
jgi:methyl-accepting chemotaxis protein